MKFINVKFQLGQAQGTLPRTSTSNQIQRQRTATALTSASYSGEMLASSTESTCSTSVTTSSGYVPGAPPLSMSTSLDTMVHFSFHDNFYLPFTRLRIRRMYVYACVPIDIIY